MSLHDRSTRRRFVSVVAAVVGGSLAGCTGDATDDTPSPSREGTPISAECERENQGLPDLRVRNRHSEPHAVRLTVDGQPEDGSSETIYDERFDLGAATEVGNPDATVTRAIAFDPDAEAVERADEFAATASTGGEAIVTEAVYSTVVGAPLRYGIVVEIDSDGRLAVSEQHWDAPQEWEPDC